MLSHARPSGPVRLATAASCAIHHSASAGFSRMRCRSFPRPLRKQSVQFPAYPGNREVEGLGLPPREHVGLDDARVGKRQRRVRPGPAPAVLGAHPPHPLRLVRAKPDHRVPALEPQAMARVRLDAVAFQVACAEADVDRGHEALARDERGEGLARARGGAVVHHPRSVRPAPVVLEPRDVDAPRARAGVHEVERLGALHAGVGEHHRHVAREPPAVGVEDVLQQIPRRPPAAEAHHRRARHAVGVAPGKPAKAGPAGGAARRAGAGRRPAAGRRVGDGRGRGDGIGHGAGSSGSGARRPGATRGSGAGSGGVRGRG